MEAAELPEPPVRQEEHAQVVQPGEQGDGLTERERDILAFERLWWRNAGGKEHAIRERFGLSPTRYYQLVNELLEKQAAMRAEPMLVKRLRRLRSSRQRARTARRLGIERR